MTRFFNNKIYIVSGIVIITILLLYMYSPTKFYNLLYGILPFAFILICPLSMFSMMKMMMGKDKDKEDQHKNDKTDNS